MKLIKTIILLLFLLVCTSVVYAAESLKDYQHDEGGFQLLGDSQQRRFSCSNFTASGSYDVTKIIVRGKNSNSVIATVSCSIWSKTGNDVNNHLYLSTTTFNDFANANYEDKSFSFSLGTNLIQGTQYFICINTSTSSTNYDMLSASDDGSGGMIKSGSNDPSAGANYFKVYQEVAVNRIYFEVWGEETANTTITRIAQSPADITTTNLFTSRNVTFNYTVQAKAGDFVNHSSVMLWYKVNASDNCPIKIGNPVVCSYTDWANQTFYYNNSEYYNFSLGSEEQIYPAVYYVSPSTMNNGIKNNNLLSGNNAAYRVIIGNFSKLANYTFLEAYLNASTVGNVNQLMRVYYCNYSYDPTVSGGNYLTSPYCTLYTSISPNIKFNHTHTVNSSHILIPVTISNSAINNIKVTLTGSFIFAVNSNTNTYNFRSLAGSTSGYIYQTSNSGVAWLGGISGYPDFHVHQYDKDQALLYLVQAANLLYPKTNSTTYADTFGFDNIGISTTQVLIPNSSYNTSDYINIVYTNVSSLTSGNFTYHLSVINNDSSYNMFIASTPNISYLWKNYSLDVGQYYIEVVAIDEYGQNSTAYSELFYKYGKINITATDGLSGVAINNFNIYVNGSFYNSTTNGRVSIHSLQKGDYNITISGVGIATSSHVVSLTNSFNSYGFTSFGSNSVFTQIYNEFGGSLITQNVTIVFTSTGQEFDRSTTNGTFYIDNLTATDWLLTFQSVNYSTRSYSVTVGENTTQYLNVYLTNDTTYTQITVKDFSTDSVLEAVGITMYRFINGSWSAVESKYTDVTGKAQFFYVAEANYKFFLQKSDYDDYVFYLSPILFNSYDVSMTKSVVIDYEQDFDKLAIIYSPSTFPNNENTIFNFIISSPSGTLIDYGINVSYPNGSNTLSFVDTGSNAIGSQLSGVVSVAGANYTDLVRLDYYYTSTLGGRRNFTTYFSISDTSFSNNTFVSNRTKTYGLTVFERILIITFIIVFFCGLIAFFGHVLLAGIMSLFIMAYSTYIGFIPLWAILPSVFLGFFILAWGSNR